MTIASRNIFIKLAIAVSILLVLISATISVFYLLQGNNGIPENSLRPISLLSKIPITPQSTIATLLSIVLLPAFSALLLIYTLFSFEKTQSIEMLFFASSILAIAFEALRSVFILQYLINEPVQFLFPISRIAMMSSFFVHLTLLTGILLSIKKTSQEVGRTLFLLAFFSFLIANSIPFNSGRTSTAFILISGYTELINSFLGVFAILTILSYAIHGKTKNIPEYTRSSIGLIFFFSGYFFLKTCDSWLFLVIGCFFFLFGSKRYLSSMHTYYLWQ